MTLSAWDFRDIVTAIRDHGKSIEKASVTIAAALLDAKRIEKGTKR